MFTAESIRQTLNMLESVGLANRKPGERFANPAGETWIFQGLDFYPRSGKLQPNELTQAIDNLNQQGIDPQTIQWVNRANSGTGGFGLARFQSENGEPIIVGRWFSNINPNRQQNSWPNDAIPGNFRLQSRAARKEDSDLQPSKILTQFQENTPNSIAQQVAAKFGTDSDQYRAIESFMSQDLPATVPAGAMDQSAFQDYFCELLGPIALVQGKKVEGNAVEAANVFFGKGKGYGKSSISFNPNTIGSLYDSLLVNDDGRQIKISSKGKEGATASVTNLSRSLDELGSISAGKKIIDKYPEAVEIIRTIRREGQNRAPLVLAEHFGIINSKEIDQVLALKNIDISQDFKTKLSPTLRKLYDKRVSKDPSKLVPFYHLLAAIAFDVADHVNKKTNFSDAASTILNHAALVQVYTTVTRRGENFVVAMSAKYPSEAVTGVLLDPNKVYYSSDNKGNFTFKILKNGAKESDVNPVEPVDTGSYKEPEIKIDLDQEVKKQRLTGPGVRAARAAQRKPQDTQKALGRTKRRSKD